MKLSRLAWTMLLSATLAACADEEPPPAIDPPGPPPAGNAVFSTADEALLRQAIDDGVFPLSDILDSRIYFAHADGTSAWSTGPCPLLTEIGARSYRIEGPCTTATGVTYAGSASATNVDMSTLNVEDSVVNGAMPTLLEARDLRTSGTDRISEWLDGSTQRSSPYNAWRFGGDVTTTGDVSYQRGGAAQIESHISLVERREALGFDYADGAKVVIDGLGSYQVRGHIERGWSAAGGPEVTGWLELAGAEVLRVQLDDATDPDHCMELTIDGADFGELCPE